MWGWCRRTVPWAWLPGAPRDGEGRRMRIRMRVGWAPPFEVWLAHTLAPTRPPTWPGKKKDEEDEEEKVEEEYQEDDDGGKAEGDERGRGG